MGTLDLDAPQDGRDMAAGVVALVERSQDRRPRHRKSREEDIGRFLQYGIDSIPSHKLLSALFSKTTSSTR